MIKHVLRTDNIYEREKNPESKNRYNLLLYENYNKVLYIEVNYHLLKKIGSLPS